MRKNMLNTDNNSEKFQQTRLVKLPKVMSLTCRSKASIYADINAGIFPLPVKIGKRSIAFKLHEIQAWIDEKCNKSQGAS